MPEQHPGDDQLIELALGNVTDPEQEDLLPHLSGCHTCRAEYDQMSAAVDSTLSAAPRIEPSPGFDRTVLEAMGLATAAPRRGSHRRRRPLMVAAAAAVLGLLLGIGGTVALTEITSDGSSNGSSDGSSQVATGSTALQTDGGDQVGVVTPSRLEGEPVVVVDVTDGVAGKHYECRLRMADGTRLPAGDWVMDSSEATWVVRVPPDSRLVGLELVTRDGGIWSSAQL